MTSIHEELEHRILTLELALTDQKNRNEKYRLRTTYLKAILNNANLPIYLKDSDYKYIFVNHQFECVAHVLLDEIKGRDDFAIFPESIARLFRLQDEEVVHRRALVEFEETISLPDGVQTFLTAKFPLFDNEGKIKAVGGVCTDITPRKRAEEALLKAHDELEKRVAERTAQLNQRTDKLTETNVALKILLEKREEDKKELEEKAFLKIIQKNLEEITSSFSQHHKNQFLNLTPAQIQIAHLIKQGHTTKEIASLLNLSPSTVACHRQEIRKRLSLTNKKINLQATLSTPFND